METIAILLAERLQGVRRAIAAGRDVDGELKVLQDALAVEQEAIRMLIGELRSSPPESAAVPLRETLATTTDQVARQWGISVVLEACAEEVRLGGLLAHEVDQMVRETVANAAKHGRASEVVVAATMQGNALSLAIRDNGCGFAATGADGNRPHSLVERVQSLGGSLSVDSTAAGSKLTITLPLEHGP